MIMHQTSPCGCRGAGGTSPCSTADGRGLERTRYFGQQLIGPDDLTQDQVYFRDKLRRHNRLLHGWGVVCGACVRRGGGECELILEPGYVLGPHGDEIVIAQEVSIDVCAAGPDEAVGCCGPSVDPWCHDETVRRCAPGTLYLAVRYDECHSRPVRTLAGACDSGCGDQDCEYSRVRDSFAWALLSELPEGYTTPMQQPSFGVLVPCVRGTQRPCPPCPRSPWVVLADVQIGTDCRILSVNCFRHRRYVLSFADFFLVCPPGPGLTTGSSFMAVSAEAGLMNARARAMATGSTELVDVAMAMSEQPPRATVSVLRPDGSRSVLPAHFTVNDGETLGTFLDREGDRAYFDPQSGETVSLRDLYAAAGADPATVLHGTTDALAAFEGRTIGVAGLREARGIMSETLDPSVLDRLDREALGAPAAVGDLPGVSIRGVGPGSFLGKKVKSMTVAEIAATPHSSFVKEMARNAPKNRRAEIESQAAGIWEAAARLAGISR